MQSTFGCCDQALNMSVQDYLDLLSGKVGRDNALPVLIALAVVVISSVLIFLKFLLSSSLKKDSFILIGLADSGKTHMLSKLIGHDNLITVTSVKENETVYAQNNKNIKLIDLPGSDGIRQKFFEQFKVTSAGIIFVVDSATFTKNIKEEAELLYSVLIDDYVCKNVSQLLIACNKQDSTVAKSSKAIQSHLEKELTTLRKTRSAALTSTDGSEQKEKYLGRKGEDFVFSRLKNPKVEFVECSAKETEEMNLEKVKKWIELNM